ncbi:MAG: DUF4249 family protein [Chitinophagales bacterium]
MPQKRWVFRLLIVIIAGLFVASCTKEITGKLPDTGTHLVVDGYIESGQPPIVLLTRSSKVFGDLNINNISSFFIHGAKVTVTKDSVQQFHLEEICLRDLPLADTQKVQLLRALGISVFDSSAVPDVCAYSLPAGDLLNYFSGGGCTLCGELDHRYDLKIEANGQTITSYTTIPSGNPVDSLGISYPAAPALDSFAGVTLTVTVPPTYGHFIRYWTKRNNEPFYLPQTQSVYDDKLFIGKTFTLPVERGYPPTQKVDPEKFGYFMKGDTVTIKWSHIDSRTFDFFYSLESDGSNTPFTSYLVARSNINGGLGVWAGYGTSYYKIIIPK